MYFYNIKSNEFPVILLQKAIFTDPPLEKFSASLNILIISTLYLTNIKKSDILQVFYLLWEACLAVLLAYSSIRAQRDKVPHTEPL